MQGQGQAAGYRYRQDQAERLALNAKTQANQTDTQYREELNTTLANIDAIRSAAGQSLNSPTALAIEDNETAVSNRQRRIKVDNLNSQATQYGRDAQYFEYAGGAAMDMAYLNAASAGIKTLSGLSRQT